MSTPFKMKGMSFGNSPMTAKDPSKKTVVKKPLPFADWKKGWNKDNSYGEGLELPDSQAKPDYEEYVANFKG